MTKIFSLEGYFRSEPVFLGMEKGIFLQHSEGRGYLDTDHCHGERDIFALEDEY